MGLLGAYVVYKLGKSRGERSSVKSTPDLRDPDCINYSSFCEKFGNCDGQRCSYVADDNRSKKTKNTPAAGPRKYL
jgi:hypothetical protein